ncbi:hypothetical protein BABINDRAFT_76381 [Babjeviella inositovora NRRL Y-12698]|uniref:Uncharacterized protein n=1 Tax=Babjeviella inositovora NRRL Y-12698 TaxID=984486 RepID=A0A1E3QYM5_9ASCO|nr:uncharacterized protein BABINDRAFT_76381 [Babjeviella inositovora NRRL Y-12698]ODQ82780.1 hypothetical protein BABINDRAFT_76381 [Babjeviella inositovora NRRL Y-12698]
MGQNPRVRVCVLDALIIVHSGGNANKSQSQHTNSRYTEFDFLGRRRIRDTLMDFQVKVGEFHCNLGRAFSLCPLPYVYFVIFLFSC